jgi:hypothetical protein
MRSLHAIYGALFLVAISSTAVQAASVCANAIQGKIAWDYNGSTSWMQSNIDALCAGAEDTTGPARCFEKTMHGGVNWGGGTQWEWQNASNLCKGARNGDARVSCFVGQVASNRGWRQAIADCQRIGGSGGYRANTSTYAGAAPVLRRAPRPTTITLRQKGLYAVDWTIESTKLGYLPSVQLQQKGVTINSVEDVKIPADTDSVRLTATVAVTGRKIVSQEIKKYGCITFTGDLLFSGPNWTWQERCE